MLQNKFQSLFPHCNEIIPDIDGGKSIDGGEAGKKWLTFLFEYVEDKYISLYGE